MAYGLRIFFMSLFLFGCAVLFRKLMKARNDTANFTLRLLAGVAGVFLTIGIMMNVSNEVLLWLAPKIWLLEYTAELLKG